MLRFRTPGAALSVAIALTARSPAAAQVWDSAMVSGEAMPQVSSLVEDRHRLLQNLGLRDPQGFLIRSTSSLARPGRSFSARTWTPLPPVLATTWNSRIPSSRNDGTVWAGKGFNGSLTAGVRASGGPFVLTIAPSVTFSQNSSFDALLPDSMRLGGAVAPWRTGRHSADLPVRFGDDGRLRADWGESSLVAALGAVEAGLANESQWWGPGIRNAIVMTDNAGGFPHLFLRTSPAVRTGIGDVEAKWIVGRLSESGYFDGGSAGEHRFLSGFVGAFRPAGLPDLTLGMTRVVYGHAGEGLSAFGHPFDVFTMGRENVPAEGDSLPASGREQILSLFGRWIFFEEGLEVYAEWARTELPSSVRDLVTRPYHSQGYVVGLQWARPVRPGGIVRVQTELASLEQSSTALRRYMPRYYTSPIVPQGYTHRGQVLGASIGPGASSQFGGVDYLGERWQAGIFGERIRWDNDAYYTRPNYVFGHDVSLLGGIRGAVRLPRLIVEAELSTGTRFDYLFQNTAHNHQSAADSAVDVRNHSLRVVVTPVRMRRPPPAEPAAPPPVAQRRVSLGSRAAEGDRSVVGGRQSPFTGVDRTVSFEGGRRMRFVGAEPARIPSWQDLQPGRRAGYSPDDSAGWTTRAIPDPDAAHAGTTAQASEES